MRTFVDTTFSDAPEQIADALKKSAENVSRKYQEALCLCIGSDRMTGDCLGPLTGQILKSRLPSSCKVYGTLNATVHACNLREVLKEIHTSHPDALIIAVDASLGSKKHLGYATISDGALLPGAGVQKILPPAGDVHITGIVNISGAQEYLMLQTTRLSMVLALADVIAQGILLALPAIL